MPTKITVLIALIVLIIIAVFSVQVLMITAYYGPGYLDGEGVGSGDCLFFRCEKISYISWANVSDPSMEIGFDVGPEDLRFGQIPNGGKGKRFINIDNPGEISAKLRFLSFGNISKFVHFSKNDIILEGGQTEKINVEFWTEPDMENGEYTGGVTLVRISPPNSLLNFMLGWV